MFPWSSLYFSYATQSSNQGDRVSLPMIDISRPQMFLRCLTCWLGYRVRRPRADSKTLHPWCNHTWPCLWATPFPLMFQLTAIHAPDQEPSVLTSCYSMLLSRGCGQGCSCALCHLDRALPASPWHPIFALCSPNMLSQISASLMKVQSKITRLLWAGPISKPVFWVTYLWSSSGDNLRTILQNIQSTTVIANWFH